MEKKFINKQPTAYTNKHDHNLNSELHVGDLVLVSNEHSMTELIKMAKEIITDKAMSRFLVFSKFGMRSQDSDDVDIGENPPGYAG